MKMTVEELGEIIALHKKWIFGETGGSRASLYGANLYGASLYGANLYGANLYGASLYGANLYGASLYGANLYGASLYGAKNADGALAQTVITPEGDLIGYKKCLDGNGGHCIVKLRIPSDAKRSNASGRKCRAEWAEVLEVDGATVGISSRNDSFRYVPGEKVVPDKWNNNRWDECSSGIHFFITRSEAEKYHL
jgi:hypothetical protein